VGKHPTEAEEDLPVQIQEDPDQVAEEAPIRVQEITAVQVEVQIQDQEHQEEVSRQ
jgi:hypothetical protein